MDHEQLNKQTSHLPNRPTPARLRSQSYDEEVSNRHVREPPSLGSRAMAAEGNTNKIRRPAARTPPRRTSAELRADFQAYIRSRAHRIAPKDLRRIEEGISNSPPESGTELEDLVISYRPSLPPRQPARSIESSIRCASHRVSLTPSDVQIPVAHLEMEGAQELLGLRSRAKEVEPHVLPWDHYDPPIRHTTIIADPGEPKGGSKAWQHAFAAILIVFNCWGFSNSFGLFQAYYERYYLSGVSPSAIAWIGSTQIALVFLLGIPVGLAVDRGYFKIAFYGGTLIMILGLFFSSFCTSWFTLWLTQGVLAGLGSGSVFTAGLIALMSWFDEKQMGTAMALAAAGSCLGGTSNVLVSRRFLPLYGFEFTIRILTAIAILTMIPPCVVFRMRRQAHRNRPRTMTRRKLLSVERLLVFADPPYLSAAAGLFLAFQGLYFGFVYIVDYAVQVLQLDTTAATNLLIFMLIANLPGRLVPGFISDKFIGPLNTLIPGTIISSIIIWSWLTSGDVQQGGLTAIACLYGFFSAGIQALYASTTYSFCLELRNTNNPTTPCGTQAAIDTIGLKAGGLFTCIGVGCLVGTPISGALLHYRTDRGLDRPFLYAQCFAAVTLLLGAALLTLSRVQKVGLKAKRA